MLDVVIKVIINVIYLDLDHPKMVTTIKYFYATHHESIKSISKILAVLF